MQGNKTGLELLLSPRSPFSMDSVSVFELPVLILLFSSKNGVSNQGSHISSFSRVDPVSGLNAVTNNAPLVAREQFLWLGMLVHLPGGPDSRTRPLVLHFAFL